MKSEQLDGENSYKCSKYARVIGSPLLGERALHSCDYFKLEIDSVISVFSVIFFISLLFLWGTGYGVQSLTCARQVPYHGAVTIRLHIFHVVRQFPPLLLLLLCIYVCSGGLNLGPCPYQATHTPRPAGTSNFTV